MRLKQIYSIIRSFAQKLINIQVRLLLAVVYFIVITPFAIFVKLFTDPLQIKKNNRPYWRSHSKILNISEFYIDNNVYSRNKLLLS